METADKQLWDLSIKNVRGPVDSANDSIKIKNIFIYILAVVFELNE